MRLRTAGAGSVSGMKPIARRARTLLGRVRHRRRGVIHDARIEATVWLLPILALAFIYYFPRHVVSVNRALAYLLAFCLLVVASRRADLSLLILIVLLPFQGLLLAKLWALGAPASVVKQLGSWKEVLALAVVVAGARGFIASKRRVDAVDRLALAFVGLAALYFVLQPVIVPSAPSSVRIRALGFRETAGFVLLLLGARHAPFPRGFARKAGRVVLAVGVAVAAIGIYEAILPDAWNRFVVGTMEYTRYQVAVLGTVPQNMWNILTYGQLGSGQLVRIGSVFLGAGTCGFYLLLSFALGLERTVRRGPWLTGLLPTLLIGAALLLTQTRSAIVGGLIVAFLAFQPTAGRARHFRTQAAIVLGALALVAVPAAAATGVLSRFALLNSSSDTSTAGHARGFSAGLGVVAENPLGLGLGTGAGTGQRFAVQDTTIPENNYLEIGDEIGILPMLVFVALAVALILRLRRSARARPDPLLSATMAAATGLAVGAWFLQTWSDLSVAWTFWGVAGAMLGAARWRTVRAAEPESPAPEAGVPGRSAWGGTREPVPAGATPAWAGARLQAGAGVQAGTRVQAGAADGA